MRNTSKAALAGILLFTSATGALAQSTAPTDPAYAGTTTTTTAAPVEEEDDGPDLGWIGLLGLAGLLGLRRKPHDNRVHTDSTVRR